MKRSIDIAIQVIGAGVMLLAAIGIWTVWEEGRWADARKAWLAECKGSVVACATAWDKSPTLRDLFWDRSR